MTLLTGVRGATSQRVHGTGNEVDLIEPEGHQVHAIEIKAGATISSDYFNGLTKFKNAFPETFLDGTLIYAGDQSQQRTKWMVRSWLVPPEEPRAD